MSLKLLLPGESRGEFDALLGQLLSELDPVGTLELALADVLARYQSALDIEVYEATRVLRETQKFRLEASRTERQRGELRNGEAPADF